MSSRTNLETWQVHKPAVTSASGLVATQHYLASEVGAQVLREGGNAVDAAIATGLAIGVVEPWMSGIGGGGFMQVFDNASGTVTGIDFAMVSPLATDPGDYPLSGGMSGMDVFNWPSVVEDRNAKGPYSIAVPGHISGVAKALERYGTWSWQQVIEPAVELARFGLPIDWFATLKIANFARDLAAYPTSREVYLADGLPPVAPVDGRIVGMPWGNLTTTYERLREAGPDDFYSGALAADIARDAADVGCKMTLDDLAAYEALPFDTECFEYRDARVWAPTGLNAGPSLRMALETLSETSVGDSHGADGAPSLETYRRWANALLGAYEYRLRHLGVGAGVDGGNTTHLGVVDGAGNIVSWTQTVMSGFGSKVVFPRTGMTMNNGMMWFDPVAERPNSIRPGVRPLSNMCPTIVELGNGFRFAIGACGGRKIFPAVFQLISMMVDLGLSVDQAMHCPRLDVSGTQTVTLDDRIASSIVDSMSNEFEITVAAHAVYPNLFALPNIVGIGGDSFTGGAFIMSPTAKVAIP
jgi:gamma-glutamyltranspeptidase/glutathione hydrolase